MIWFVLILLILQNVGSATTIDRFPYQISIRYLDKHYCGGAIISSKVIITTAVIANDSEVLISGWGSQTNYGPFAKRLRFTNITVIDTNACNITYDEKIGNGMLCAGTQKERRGPSYGDNGGPLTFNGTLVGLYLYSWGKIYGHKDYPAVFTRISYYTKWISHTMFGTCFMGLWMRSKRIANSICASLALYWLDKQQI